MEEDRDVEVTEWSNSPSSNVLEKGRYILETVLLKKHKSDSGNQCIYVEFMANNVKLKKYFVLKDVKGNPHQLVYSWKNYLYAIGIRDPRKNFTINLDSLEGKKCKGDVTKHRNDEASERAGFDIYENDIRYFSPIDKEEAPMKDVPEEPSKEKPKEEEKPKEKQTETKKIEEEGIDDL